MRNIVGLGVVSFFVSLVATVAYGQARTPYTRPSSITTTGPVSAANYNATTASGNQAYTCTNTGCRLSLGSTARYLVDDGTNLEFVAPLQATTFEATTASGSSLTGGGASGPLLITSNTPDSHTTASVPAFVLQTSENIASGDLIFAVRDSLSNNAMTLRKDGLAIFSNSVQAGNDLRVAANILATSSASDFIMYAQRTAGSTTPAVRIGNSLALTSDQANLVSVGNYVTGTWTTQAHFSKDGLLRVNQQNAAKPTCNADNRGRLFFLDGGAGVADIMEVCMKEAGGTYGWETVATAAP